MEYLIVNVLPVEGNVDGEGRRVVMWPQKRLLVGTVTHHKVHDGLSLHTHTCIQSVLLVNSNNDYPKKIKTNIRANQDLGSGVSL